MPKRKKRVDHYSPARRLQEVVALINSSGGATVYDIAERLKVSVRTAIRYLRALEKAGEPFYEEMEGRDYERAQLQIAVARSLRARKEIESLRQAYGLLQEVACSFPELAKDDLQALERILELNDAAPPSTDTGAQASKALGKVLGHPVRVLVVGGNERQRRHHPRFEQLAETWGFQGEWVMTNYTSPQKVVGTVADRLRAGIDVLVLLHWNRHETTEPALDLARKADVPARTVHYAGFTSLQVALGELLEKMAHTRAAKAGSRG